MTDLFAVHTAEHPVLDVVFIHGLDGNGRTTWQRDGAESFWPNWLARDVDDISVWSINYNAGSTKWRRGRGMAIQDRAVNLMVQMQNHRLGERGLCFITHSMGGLLVKEILLHAAESRTEFAEFATAAEGVVFLSTPHTGAAVANALRVLPYRRSAAAKALTRNDPYLRHLNDRYRDWATDSGIDNLVFYETLATKTVRVVDEASANPGIPLVRPIPIDANHIDIGKPAGRSAPMYGRVLRFVSGIRDGLSATEGPAPPNELLARVRDTSSAARPSLAPEVLPNIDRLADLTGKFHQLVQDIPTPLVLIGDGGLGKSVLLGQICDEINALGNDSGVILLPCNRIPASTPLDSVAQIDLALGAVAVDRRDAPPLSELLTRLDATASTYILIDTIDLIVRDDNADAVGAVLRELADSRRVVWSCRDLEWHTYLRAIPGINESQYRMPLLEAAHIEAWARAYAATKTDLAAGVAESFIDSLVGADSSPRVREVCNTPLRLAMACEVYIGDGGIPEDLSVTELYERYWDKCIASDRRGLGPRSLLARRQDSAADSLAGEIWNESIARFALSVTGDSVVDDEAMNLLLSEAVVIPLGGRFGFFHQTFGEYAVARRLRRVGDQPDFAKLRSGLQNSKVPAYWPIARHLVMLDMDDERYAQVCAAIPLSEVEGGKLQLLGAFNRRSINDVTAVAEGIRDISLELLVSNASVLTLAPQECLRTAMQVLIECVGALEKSMADGDSRQRGNEKSLSPVVVAAGELQRQFRIAEQRAAAIGDMLDAIISCGAVMTEAATASVMRRFVGDVLQEAATDQIADELVLRYRSLLPATQREIIRAVAAGRLDSGRDRQLLLAAREFPCPERSVDDLTAVLLRAWPDSGFRQRMGWSTWRDILESRMLTRWESCQIRVVADLCRDQETAEAVLEVATRGIVDDDISDRYINIAKFIADDHRDSAIRTVLDLPAELTTTAIGVACEIVTHTADLLPSEYERQQVIAQLLSWISIVPRTVWPATIKAAGTHHRLLDERIAALAEYCAQVGNATVIGSSVDTFLNTLAASPATLSVYADRLRAMCGGSDIPNRCRRARLDGLTCLTSSPERQRIRTHIADPSARVASSAATAVAFAVNAAPATALDEHLGIWLFGLLDSPYQNTKQTIAEVLHTVADQIAWTARSAEAAADLLQDSLPRGDDPQAARALVTLLADISRSSPLEPALAVRVVRSLRSNVLDLLPASVPQQRRRHLPAIYGIYKLSLTALAIPHMPLAEVHKLVLDDLVTIDVGEIAGRSERPLADLLTRLARIDAQFLTQLEEIWELTSAANKGAIGKCMKNIEVGTAGTRSMGLARRPDCPSAVAAMIHRTFG
ncbi:alpha/beta hydrolase [Nocardia salmonicida]|uniref:alpha/beta hydrolase n=1 Tax=Nocardia salmonicida TaxID=53431 RepID=UPI0014719A26|nr:hypothetical protein [Nocardia salmonicida]